MVFIPAGTLAGIAADLHLSYARAGLLLSMLSVGGVAGGLLTVAADHVSRRALAAGGAAVIAGCLLAFGLSPWFAGLLLAALIWGTAGDALVSGAEVALVDVSGKHLTPALGRQNLLGAAGDLLGPLVIVAAGLLRVGWRALFVGSALLMAGYSAWLGLEPLPAPSPEPEVSVVGGVVRALRDFRAWMLAGAEAVLTVVDEPYLAFLIIFLERVRGAPLALAALVATADLAGSAIGSFLAPRLLRRHERGWLLVSATALPLAIAALVGAPEWWAQFLASTAAGFCAAVIWVAVQSMTLTLHPSRPGATQAVVGWMALPALAFPVVVGAVADRAGLVAAMGTYVLATIALAVLMVPLTAALRRGR